MWIGYDIETSGTDPEYALQPWRVREGSAEITLSCAWSRDYSDVQITSHELILDNLRQSKQYVATWNGVFDLAWLYAAELDTSGIVWFDVALLWKWSDNSQRTQHISRSLASGAKTFLKDWDQLETFLKIKDEVIEPGADPEYWRSRVILDAQATALIAEKIWVMLTDKQKRAAIIQATTLPTIAASWVNGIVLDLERIKDSEPTIIKEMLELEVKLGLTHKEWIPYVEQNGLAAYIPNKILSSPKKLANLVYSDWKLPCTRFSKKLRDPSADKTALTYLADLDDRILDILTWRSLNTIRSKFVAGPLKAAEYLGNNITHSQPRVFSTYTGRMTYSSKQGKAKIGIPIHQTPRKKEIRKYVVAPPGNYIVEFDASGQEMRGMAVMSQDETMIQLFNSKPPYDDGHSLTGAAIGGMDIDEFLAAKAAGDLRITGPNGLRHMGKFYNLSIAYRTGLKTLRLNARVQYGLNLDATTTKKNRKATLNLYPGIKEYWKTAPKLAEIMGYAETIAGRRFGITNYSDDYIWSSESSAINFPIQGMGADQRDLAIAVLIATYPDMRDKFYFDLHDGMYWIIPKNYPTSYVAGMLKTLNSIDYKKYWNVDLPIPYVWDCSFGPDWGSKVDFKLDNPETTLEKYYEERL